eukprot:175966-Prymnesium_polylepis.1
MTKPSGYNRPSFCPDLYSRVDEPPSRYAAALRAPARRALAACPLSSAHRPAAGGCTARCTGPQSPAPGSPMAYVQLAPEITELQFSRLWIARNP